MNKWVQQRRCSQPPLRRSVGRFYEIRLSGLHFGVTLSGGGWTLGSKRARMKKCTYCGRRYPDETTACTVDQSPLEFCKAISIFGMLSVAAPFIGGFIIWIMIQNDWIVSFLYIPPAFALLIALPSLTGVAFAFVSWIRDEPNRKMRRGGLFFNVAILFIWLVLVLLSLIFPDHHSLC